MKTKEEFIKDHYGCVCHEIYTSRRMIDPSCTLHEHGPEIELIMEEYSQQTAISFAEFIFKGYRVHSFGGEWMWEKLSLPYGKESYLLTTQQVYDLFLQSQSK